MQAVLLKEYIIKICHNKICDISANTIMVNLVVSCNWCWFICLIWTSIRWTFQHFTATSLAWRGRVRRIGRHFQWHLISALIERRKFSSLYAALFYLAWCFIEMCSTFYTYSICTCSAMYKCIFYINYSNSLCEKTSLVILIFYSISYSYEMFNVFLISLQTILSAFKRYE